MGLFNKILGKSNDKAEKQIEKEIEQIKSGEINKAYPILKPGDWVGLKAGALRQTLLGTPEDPHLVIAFGYDTPENFVFLTHSQLEGKDLGKIVEDAYGNLEDVDLDFQALNVSNGKILTASGHDFSSEKILCKSHMMKAHEILGAEQLLVSIPRRRCMVVTARNVEAELLDIFVTLHEKMWNDDSFGNAPIFNELFVVKNGDIIGSLPVNQ